MLKAQRLFFLMALALAAAVFSPTFASASRADLFRIAADGLVGGWSPVQDSSTYVGGDRLQDIYNGGYEVYVKAGVLEALRRMYARGSDYVEVTVHTMKSAQAAREFLAERHKLETGKEAPKAPKWNRFSASGAGSTTGYAVQGRYFITVVSYYEGEKGRQQTAEFIKPLEEKAAKLGARK